jgi:hypothetical protein
VRTSPFCSAAYSLRCKVETLEAILFPCRSCHRCLRTDDHRAPVPEAAAVHPKCAKSSSGAHAWPSRAKVDTPRCSAILTTLYCNRPWPASCTPSWCCRRRHHHCLCRARWCIDRPPHLNAEVLREAQQQQRWRLVPRASSRRYHLIFHQKRHLANPRRDNVSLSRSRVSFNSTLESLPLQLWYQPLTSNSFSIDRLGNLFLFPVLLIISLPLFFSRWWLHWMFGWRC